MDITNDKEHAPERQERRLKTACPFCLFELDVHLDIKGRPYWRCWRCEVRSFGTKTAFSELQMSGWIWSDKGNICLRVSLEQCALGRYPGQGRMRLEQVPLTAVRSALATVATLLSILANVSRVYENVSKAIQYILGLLR